MEQVTVGERVLVRPGGHIPVDGRVLEGRSAVNQAPVTGESLPVPKGPGEIVLAGTINGEAALEIEVTQPAADSTISKIVRLVEQAQSQRAPVERFVDRFAAWYTPAVVGIAVLLCHPPAAVLWRAVPGYKRDPRLAVPRPGAADRGLPVRAGHLHPGHGGQRPHRAGAARGAGEGRAVPGRAGAGEDLCLR